MNICLVWWPPIFGIRRRQPRRPKFHLFFSPDHYSRVCLISLKLFLWDLLFFRRKIHGWWKCCPWLGETSVGNLSCLQTFFKVDNFRKIFGATSFTELISLTSSMFITTAAAAGAARKSCWVQLQPAARTLWAELRSAHCCPTFLFYEAKIMNEEREKKSIASRRSPTGLQHFPHNVKSFLFFSCAGL